MYTGFFLEVCKTEALATLQRSFFAAAIVFRQWLGGEGNWRGCTAPYVRGQTSVGLSGYTSVHRNIIESHETPSNPMELHGILQNLTESHERLWNIARSSGC
jgi:hypothetical protein